MGAPNGWVSVCLVMLSGIMLTGCIRGSHWSGAGGVSINEPATPAAPAPVAEPVSGPTPTPTPTPPPVPTPTPAPIPPLSPIVVNLDDNHRVGIPHWPAGDSSTGGQGETVGTLECFPDEPPETYHVHSHLSIFLDGVALSVPGQIGIVTLTPTRKCYYTLHTHDSSGKLHVEAATPAMFTLGEFFRIWGQPLGPDNVAGLIGKPIVVYITDHNGVVVEATGNWNDIELLSHREITIQVGTPISEIPNYTWTVP